MEKRYIVGSSHLIAASHDNKDMFIDFKNGSRYRYNNVGYHTFDALTKSESPGKFFHMAVKDKFICSKV